MVYLTQEALEIAGGTAPNRSRHETRGGTRIERTKYTPKRLLSLLLALIMLLGMFPTAALAAEPAGGIVLNSDDYKAHGLIFKFEPILPEGPYFENSTDKAVTIHYTISTATGKDYVKITELSEFVRYNNAEGGEIANSRVHVKASDITDTNMVEDATGGATATPTTVKVFKPGVVIAQGDVTEHPIISADDGGTGKIVQKTYFAAQWVGAFTSENYNTNETEGEGSIKTMKVSARYLPLGYSVSYNNGGYTGTAGIPVGTFRTTGSGKDNQSFTISDVTPTLAGCTFKGWSSDTWENKDADGNPVLFQPGDTVKKVISDTVLTAVWKENASEHKVEFFHNFLDGSDNSLFTTVHVADGEGAENPGAPYKHPEGYIFKDWCVKAEVGGEVTLTPYDFAAPVTEDIKLYADWTQVTEETTYTVTFDVGVANAGPVPGTQVVKKDAVAIEPTTEPTRDGYTFAGWYLVQADGSLANEAYNFGTAVTKDITLRAKWNRNTVTIEWPTTPPTGVYEIHHPKAPYYEGSTVSFNVVWMKGYTPSTVLAKGQPLGAVTSTDTEGYEVTTYTFTADADPIKVEINPAVKKTYTITLPSGNGFYAIFSESNKPDAVNAMSYTFEYGDTFKIKFVAQAGMQAQLFVNGKQHLSLPDGGEITCTDTHTVTGDCVVSAFAIQRVFHTVTYVLEPYSGLYTVQSVEHGQATSAPAKPEIPGYEFNGWYSDANLTDSWAFAEADTPDKITKDTVIYGKLTPLTYEVNYEANAGTDATVSGIPTDAQTKTHGVALTLANNTPTREGYTFKGWATSPTGPVAYQPGGQYLNDAPITLYAVWEKLAYTVTISSGAGYSTVPAGVATVNWHDPFTFTVNVDRQYAAKAPEVVDSVEGALTAKTGEVNHTGATSYTYEIGMGRKIEENRNITITVTQNAVHQVSFYVAKVTPGANGTSSTVTEQAPFLIQSVEHGYYASMPAAPEREGFKFKGYYKEDNTMVFPFNDAILADTTVHAVYEAIQPKITVVKVKDAANGWELKDWQHGSTGMTSVTPTDNTPFTIAYGDDVTFNLVIQPGYDYSKLSVSANGYELGRESIKTENGVTTISFRLVYVTANTRITVSGIERKTITVTYNENALDHVSNLPAPQTANYYIDGDGNNTKFTDQVPVRNGYTFLGWSTDGSVTAEEFKNATEGPMTDANAKKYFKIDTIKTPGVEIPFTADTTVYAIWEAQKSTVTLTFGDTALHAAEYDIQYEGETFTLNAEFNAHVKGTAIFYVGKTAEKDAAEKLGEVAVNGKTASYSTSADKYLTPANQHFRYYWVEFQSETVEGYTDCEAGPIKLKIFSRAITWTPLGEGNHGTLTIKDANGDSAQAMTAGQTYTLTVNTDKITGLECVKPNDAPALGKHYKIVWQYKKTATSDWETVPGEFTDTNEYQVTPGESGYEFRAKIYPMGELYNKAVKFENNAYVANQYDVCLYTNTTKSVKENTEIALTTDAEDEANTVVIKNGTPFDGLSGDMHKAQFEGQTITLTAKVTKEGTQTGVESGSVEFYQKKDNDWTLIATVPVQPEGQNMGVAAVEATMSAYTDPVAEAKDEFYAKYVPNETYETSTTETTPLMVYIKSAQLQIPVIADVDTPAAHTGKWIDAQGQEVANGDNKTATSYDYHLGGLTAGIKHTFQLKQTGANQTDKADWSVVALDGRTVAGDMYTMKWETLTDANWKTTTTTGDTYTAETTKVGDRYHILLTGAKNSPFDGSKVVSKDIAIGDPQGVTVTVEAIDAIKATEVDRNNGKYPDVYQLNEITLTATVEAAEAGADRKPTGIVAFYYVDENNAFQPLGEAELKPDTSGKMVAQITTDELPVETKTKANTKLDSVITAVYYGDETFKPSENWDEANKKVTDAEVKDAADKYLVKSDAVTVYSSVVYNCTDENKNQTTDGERGIHISKADGLFLANESATLKLSDVYTLDWKLGDDLRDIVAKLNPNKDYTIQWQKLTGATNDRDFAKSKRWEDITGATGTTLLLKPVEQDTAYRAVITVKDPATPIVKGSFELIDQGTVNTKDANDGRQVYYSNVMMPTSGETTIAVAVNTNERGDNLEGITEGETVTVNVLVSGAVGAVPNATLNVTITADDTKGNETNYKKTFTSKATVDGWNAFEWDTVAEQVQPGFYTLTVVATSNTGYMTETITRSLIVRESSYKFNVSNLDPTYNGRTQGVSVALDEFHFNGSDIDAAAAKSWTVKYYDKVTGKQVEPSQAGTYTAKVTLPASAYWTEKVEEFTFTIEQRKVYVEDAVAQAKVYDGKTNVNLVEVILNDAETDQGTTGLPTNDIGIINGDSIYATATGTLRDANAGENEFTVSDVQLHGDDADNYVVDGTKTYEEPIYVSRSQVYGETGTLKLKQGEQFPADQVIKMIDQAGSKLKANEGYTLTFYYHSDTKIEKTEDLSKTGLYTVVARPNQDNYKGGVTMKFEVVKDAADAQKVDAAEPQPSTLIDLTNTATMYNPMGNVGVTATSSQDNTVEVKYQNGTDWSTDVPANAGRYLVKATDAISGDVAYGIYTITKAHPEIRITAEGTTYNSMPYDVATKVVTENNGAESYLTYAGDVAIGFDTPTDGNVAEQAPVDAGSYVVTLHVNETQNYTAHEVSAPFVIAQKPLTITTHSKQSTQYDAFPGMTAKYEGLAYSTSDNTNDTSLRDVQIAPEFLFNYDKGGFTNHALDQVGGAKIKPADALAKNYVITYVDGEYTRQRTNFKPDLAIYGLPVNGSGENVAYYGDEVQLYHYGYYTDHENGSSVMRWSVKKVSFEGEVTVGEKTGILNVKGVGTFEVTLKRGEGEQAISTTVTVTAIKKELGVHLLDQDKVYTGSNQDYSGTVTVYDELYKTVAVTPDKGNLGRTDIGTQLPSGQVPAAETYYQSLIYRGKYTINDKEATVEPQEDTHIYGQTRQIKGYDDLSNALINGLTASQTDDYNRLDVHDGYEILVAGTENMNYNVKYVTDQTAKDSAVTTYGGVKFTSETTEYLNDATVYGETPNVLDWTLENTIESIRGSKSYADNLADFDLESIFVEQDYDNCVGNADCGKFDYKAANRTTTAPDTYNVGVLGAKRTAANENAHSNYTLKFKTVTNSGALNYQLTDAQEGNKNTTTNALRAGSLGYDGGNATLEAGENFIEGSANIAQRPVTVKKASTIGTVRLYWRLPQSKLYTALLNILEAEGNSTNRGLAKGHTIRDLDLTISIQGKPIDPNSNNALEGLTKGDAQVVVKVGDTNYVLDGDGKIDGVELKTIQIEATYTTKTATNFVVLIKVRNEDGRSTTPLKSADGLTYEILRKVNGSFDGKVYATGSLTYTGRTATDKFGDECGVFTASYGPLSNIGGTYFIQMYEYGVALKTENS